MGVAAVCAGEVVGVPGAKCRRLLCGCPHAHPSVVQGRAPAIMPSLLCLPPPAGEPCSVCHDEFEEGKEVLELPCNHCFHEVGRAPCPAPAPTLPAEREGDRPALSATPLLSSAARTSVQGRLFWGN